MQVPLLGMVIPVAARASQVLVVVSHHSAVVQSAFTLQPPDRTQVPLVEHSPDRHTVVDVAGVQVP